MQSCKVMLVNRTIPASASIPTHIVFEGFGSEGLIEATSKVGFSACLWPEAMPARSANNAVTARDFISSCYASAQVPCVRHSFCRWCFADSSVGTQAFVADTPASRPEYA